MPQAIAALAIPTVLALIGTVVATAAVSIAVGFLTASLAPKPKKPKLPNLAGLDTAASNRLLTIRQPIVPWRIIYGETRVGGSLIYITTTVTNKYLHMVIVLASHQIQAINTVQLGDDLIFNDDIDSNGNVTAGKYKDKARIKKHLGTAAQAADSDLVCGS